MPFDPDQATRPKVPSFKFGKIGDGFKLTITDVSDDVETINSENGVTIKDTNLVLVGTIQMAQGGDRDDKDSPTTDTPIGEERSIWLRYRRDSKPSAAPITTACALALKMSGADTFQPGGVLSVRHTEVGNKPTNPAHSRAKLFKATYEPPTRATADALLGGSVTAVTAPAEDFELF
jgi:hypothetical protein